MDHRIFSLFFPTGLLFILTISGCGGGSDSQSTSGSGGVNSPNSDRVLKTPAKVDPDIYIKALQSGVPTLDPAEVTDTTSHEVALNLFDGLVEFDDNLNPSPALAETWDISEDKKTYTFHLRSKGKKAKFHAFIGENKAPTLNGGREVNAGDFKYSFERCVRLEKRAWVFENLVGIEDFVAKKSEGISGIEVGDPHTLILKLKEPFAPFLTVLCMPNAAVVPREDVENPELPFGENPVGTGAFYFISHREKVKVVLGRNDDYFLPGETARVKRVELPIIVDENARWMAFENGDIYHSDIPDPKYQTTKQDPKWDSNIQEMSQYGTYYLGMNVNKAPFDNIKIRKAFNFAINREEICHVIVNDRVKPAKGVLPPGIKGYNPDLKGYRYNLEKAEELLREAGFPEGKGFPEIQLQYNQDEAHKRVAEYVQSNLIDLGIKITLKVVDWPSHIESLDKGDVPFFRLGWVADYPDPDNFLYILFHSSKHGAGGNQTWYNNPKVDQLLEEGRRETDLEKRIPLYQEAENIIVEEAPWVFIYHYTAHVISQPWVEGLVLNNFGRPVIKLRKLSIKKG